MKIRSKSMWWREGEREGELFVLRFDASNVRHGFELSSITQVHNV